MAVADSEKPKTEPQTSNPLPEPVTANNLPSQSSPKTRILFLIIPLLIIALGAAGLVFYQMFLKTPSKDKVAQKTEEVLPLTLTVTSPSDNSVITESLLTIKGVTTPNTTVLLYTEENDNSVESDENGNFTSQINLVDGINTLTVTAFSANGEEKTIAYNLVYDNQVQGIKDPPGQVKSNSSSGQAVVGNVEETTPNLKVTGKDKKTMEIQVDKNTKIINQNKKEVKLNSLKKSDLTAIISDNETATNSKQLKKALKIYVRDATTSAQIQSKRKAISGVIQSVSGNLITLTHQIQTDRVYQLYVSSTTIVKIKDLPTATIADLKAGQRIAAVGDLNEENQLTAKRIHVIPGKATGVFNKYPTSAPTATPPSGTLITTPTATPSGSLTPTIVPTVTTTPTPALPTLTIETPPNP